MKVNSLKTHKITKEDNDILAVLDKYITSLKEGSIVAITSKIISITEGSIVEVGKVDKYELIKKEADMFLPIDQNKYNVMMTIKNKLLVASAGIDQSNGNGFYILLPKNPQGSANKIREFLLKKFNLKKVGVIITDSKTSPLRWGVTGYAIAHSGFNAVNDLIGQQDVFGQEIRLTKVNVVDALATAAVFEMGEADEQTPIAIIEDVPQVDFQDRDPTQSELEALKIELENDLYSVFLTAPKWQKKE